MMIMTVAASRNTANPAPVSMTIEPERNGDEDVDCELVVDTEVVDRETFDCWKKLAGSIKVGSGVWLKSNIESISFTRASRVPRDGRLKTVSANFSIEENSYWVWSMRCGLTQGEITRVGTLKPSPNSST